MPVPAATPNDTSTACGVTTHEYAFDNSQQIALGVLGAGYTAEQVLKGAYEGTLGHLVEWLQTNPSPSIPYFSRCWSMGVPGSQYHICAR